MKKQILFVLLIAFSIGSKISAQTNTEKSNNATVSILPSDFPIYVNNGDPETDKGLFLTAKYSWLEANMEIYLNYVNSITEEQKRNGLVSLEELEENEKLIQRIIMSRNQSTGPIKVSREEFNSLPTEKQKLYLAEPDKYIIVD